MEHLVDPSIDTNEYRFKINPVTREISISETNRCRRVRLMQFDHNSKRFVFEIPKIVDGHNMQDCSKISVHYINISTDKQNTHSDIYDVNMSEVRYTDTTMIFDWLISKHATQYAGMLTFLIRFSCFVGAKAEYVWNTEVTKEVIVTIGMDNTETVVDDTSDILESWKQTIIADVNKIFVETEKKVDQALAIQVEHEAAMKDINDKINNLNLDGNIDHTVEFKDYSSDIVDAELWGDSE